MRKLYIFILSFLCTILLQTIDIQLFAQETQQFVAQNEIMKESMKDVKKFWKWFKRNENYLSKPFTYPEQQIEMVNRLNSVRNGIEYTLDINNAKYSLTITCNGNKELIPWVNLLVETAPKFENWNIIAFKQRSEIPDSIYFDDAILFAKDLKIYLVNDHRKIHIKVFVANYESQDERIIAMATDYLTKAIGEYTLMMDCGEISIDFSSNYRIYMQTVDIYQVWEAIQNEKKMLYSN